MKFAIRTAALCAAVATSALANDQASAPESGTYGRIAGRAPIAARKEAALNATPPWPESRYVDPMTDAVSYSASAQDLSSHASMLIECNKDGEGVMFESPLFLRTAERADIQMRFDGDTAETKSAFLSKRTALMWLPRNVESQKSIDSGIIALGALGVFWKLHRPHARLRVRLTSFEGDTANLDFAIAGLHDELARLEQKCWTGAPRNGAKRHPKPR